MNEPPADYWDTLDPDGELSRAARAHRRMREALEKIAHAPAMTNLDTVTFATGKSLRELAQDALEPGS